MPARAPVNQMTAESGFREEHANAKYGNGNSNASGNNLTKQHTG